jgi:hypothetical protein
VAGAKLGNRTNLAREKAKAPFVRFRAGLSGHS